MKVEQPDSVENPQATPELWQSLPNAPGVYLMKASDGTVIYVGKAIRLRTRVRSYFRVKNCPCPNLADDAVCHRD